MKNGGREPNVGEWFSETSHGVVVLEVEAYPEPKVLSAAELRLLKAVLGSNRKVATHIEGSTGLVRDKMAQKNRP